MKTTMWSRPLACLIVSLFVLCGALLLTAQDEQKSGKKKGGAKKVEQAHGFFWAAPDPLRGDWQGQGGYVAQVVRAEDKLLSVADQIPSQETAYKYQANIFHKFDQPNDKPVAILQGVLADNVVTFSGDGWTGTIADGQIGRAHV